MQTKKKPGLRKSGSSFRVREATLQDLPILVRHRREMWKGIGISPISRAQTRAERDLNEADRVYRQWVRSRMRNKTLVAWLAQERGKVVGGGCVWLQPIQPMPGYNRMLQPYLLSMYTEPDSRGEGVASAIIEHAISWARKKRFSPASIACRRDGTWSLCEVWIQERMGDGAQTVTSIDFVYATRKGYALIDSSVDFAKTTQH